MKKIFLYLLLVVSLLANPIDDKAPQLVVHGAPVSAIKKSNQYLVKKYYAIHYRYDTKTAEYVVEHVTKENISGTAKRKDDFRADPEVPTAYQSQLEDYAGNPFDRGHLVPGANNTINEEAMSQSFFLSNMVPQIPNHNRGIWKQLETFVRNWTLEGKDIYVVTGTIYNKDYKTIGANKVGIPDYLWKIVIDNKSNKAIAFLFPNAPLPVADLPKYVVTISEIEAKTQLNFMPKLTKAQSAAIEQSKANLSEWSGLTSK
jgi:endonuclease G